MLDRAAEDQGNNRGWRRFIPGPTHRVVILVSAVLAFFVVYPLVTLVLRSFQVETVPRHYDFTLGNYSSAFATHNTYESLVNSLIFALGSATLALIIGGSLAWLSQRSNMPFAKVVLPVAIIPLVFPKVLEAVAWVFLLNDRIGLLRFLPLDIYSLPGMIWVQGIGDSSLAFLMMAAAFRLMDPALEESAHMSGASGPQVVRWVTLPLLRPAAFSAFLLMFVRSLEAFAVPAVIGIPGRIYVYTTEIWFAFNQVPVQPGVGAALAIGLLIISVVGVGMYIRATRLSERFATVGGKAFRPRRVDLGRVRWPAFGVTLFVVLIIVGAPLFIVLWTSFLRFYQVPSIEALGSLSFDNFRYLFNFDAFWPAVRNSFLVSASAATLVMFLTSIVSWLRYKSRLKGMTLLEYGAMTPIAVPGLVLGTALIVLYVANPIPIYGTLWIVLIAYATKYLPYGMRFASSSMIQIGGELEEAARVSGASWFQGFRRVTLPLLRPGFVAGWIYILIVGVKEFSTSVLLVNQKTIVLSVLVYQINERGRATAVSALGVMMVLALIVVVVVFQRVTGRIGIQEQVE